MNVRRRKPRRDKVAIVAQILEVAGHGVLRTSILYGAGLSFDMLNRYVGLMMNAKLLDMLLLNDKVVCKATDRGMEFLYHYREIMELMEPEGDNGQKPFKRIQLLPNGFSSQSLH